MDLKLFAVAGLLGTAFLAGCSKQPPPTPPAEPTPPAVEEPAPEPEVDSAALRAEAEAQRRAEVEQRIGEVFVPVYFEFDQSALSGEAKTSLEAIGMLMKDASGITVVVEGHTDERGTNEYNLALGERRAQAVRDYLVSYGVDASRFSVLSYGEEKPAEEGKNEAAWSKNRRAEFRPSF